MYLLPIPTFQYLSQNKDFTNFNGETYQEYIVIHMHHILDNNLKQQIRESHSPINALQILLLNNIFFTHDQDIALRDPEHEPSSPLL